MTDPAKSDDIEDVLSSIRRLVAENAKATRDNDALVLTQKHRVRSPAPPAAPTAATRPQINAAPRPQASAPVQASIDDSAHGRIEPHVSRRGPIPADTRSAAAGGRTVDAIPPAPSTVDVNAQNAKQAPVGHQDPAVTVTQSPSPFRFSMVKPTVLSPLRDDLQQTRIAPGSAPTVDADSLADAIEDAAQDAIVKASTEEFEVLIAADEAAEPTEHFATEAGIVAQAIDESVMGFQLKHDELKAMVGELIREELRGEMGEKITRNVRKLVRREIQRALTSQQLD